MKADKIVQRIKLEQDNQTLFKKKIAAGYYNCPRTNKRGVKHGSKFIRKDGHSFYCSGKDELGRVCFYHFKTKKTN